GGAVGEPLALHGLPEDFRRGAACRGADVIVATPPPAVVVPCSRRIEGSRPITSSLPGDVEAGPIRFTGLKFVAQMAPKLLTPRAGNRWVAVNAAPVVASGGPGTVSVPPAERGHLHLAWAGGDAGAARFVPCPRSTPAFSYQGTVGEHTAWAGGFLVNGAGCRHLDIWFGTAKHVRITVSFGAGSC